MHVTSSDLDLEARYTHASNKQKHYSRNRHSGEAVITDSYEVVTFLKQHISCFKKYITNTLK